ncbi:MAG: GntR family transcriptional regulator [Alphaproteobacteria bacterium]
MRTRSQSVAEELRTFILEGELAPGTHLQEIPLAEKLQVSRTPIRAALATLETEGLLSYVPKRGYQVRSFSIDDIVDVYQVRSVLEAYAASQCAARGMTGALLEALEDSLKVGDRILAKGVLDPADLPDYRAMNARFHQGIIRGSGSSTTAELVLQTRRIPLVSDRIILWHDYWLIQRSHDDHHRVLDAIRQRQPERAGAIMREHVYFMSQVVRDHLIVNYQGGADAALPRVSDLPVQTPRLARKK